MKRLWTFIAGAAIGAACGFVAAAVLHDLSDDAPQVAQPDWVDPPAPLVRGVTPSVDPPLMFLRPARAAAGWRRL